MAYHFPHPKLKTIGLYQWTLLEDYPIYGTVIPKGFKTDGLSFIRGIFTSWNEHWSAAVLAHDWFYDCLKRGKPDPKAPTRARADRAFLELMEACGVSWFLRTMMYAAVRVFGGSAFIKSLVIK